MRYHKPHLLKNLVGRIAAAGCLLIVAASAALAQGGPPAGAGPPANNNPNLESRARQIREGALRSAEMDAAVEKRNQQRVEALVVQVKEDFAHLQIVRNEIARNLVARKPLDYHLISDQTTEINKRANRLKIYMMPRAPEDKEREPKNPPDQHPTRAGRVVTPQGRNLGQGWGKRHGHLPRRMQGTVRRPAAHLGFLPLALRFPPDVSDEDRQRPGNAELHGTRAGRRAEPESRAGC